MEKKSLYKNANNEKQKSIVKLLVDQFDVTVNVCDRLKVTWGDAASAIAETILNELKITELFTHGSWRQISGRGYINREYRNSLSDFRVEYHDRSEKRGVSFRFSSIAWNIYQKRYTEKYDHMDICVFLQTISSLGYAVNLSRIDVAADYINYDLSIDRLNNLLMSGDVILKNGKGRKVVRRKGFRGSDEDKVSTITYGKSTSDYQDVLYDKKKEQLDKKNKAAYYDIALERNSWIRHEGRFRRKQAKEITSILLGTGSDNLQNTLACLLLGKSQFFTKDRIPYQMTKLLTTVGEATPYIIDIASASSLESKTKNIYDCLMSLLSDVEEVWGIEGAKRLIKLLFSAYISLHSAEKKKTNRRINDIGKLRILYEEKSIDDLFRKCDLDMRKVRFKMEIQEKKYNTKVLNVDDIAGILSITRRSVLKYCRTKVLPATKLGKNYIITEAALDEWLRNNQGRNIG